MQRKLFTNRDIRRLRSGRSTSAKYTLSVTGHFKVDTQRNDNVGRYHGCDEKGNYYSIILLPNGDLFLIDTYNKTTIQDKLMNDIKKTIDLLNEKYSKKEEFVIEINGKIHRLNAN